MQIDEIAINITGNKLGYPRSVIEKIVSHYLTALASQEGAHPVDNLVAENERYFKQWEAQKFGDQEGAQAGEVVKQYRWRFRGSCTAFSIWFDGEPPTEPDLETETRTLYTTPPAPDEAVRVAEREAIAKMADDEADRLRDCGAQMSNEILAQREYAASASMRLFAGKIRARKRSVA